MSSMIPMAASQILGNANTRNQGGQAGFLGGSGAIDGTGQSFWNVGDPLNLLGHSSSGHFFSNVLDPGNVLGMNQAANPNGANGANGGNGPGGVPSVLPTLPGVGAPHIYGSNFKGYANLGSGPFNQMASQMAGPMYNPQAMTNPSAGKGLAPTPIGGKGGGVSGRPGTPLPIGGGRTTMPYFGALRAK